MACHPLAVAAAAYSHVRVSPDGGRLAIAVESDRDAYVMV